MEIERKFLIKQLPDNLGDYETKEIEQGYLNRNPVLRIRKSNDKFILTYKSNVLQTEENSPAVNEELEVFLTEKAYNHIREKIDNNLISQTRYIIPYEADGKEYKIELDVFHGMLEGLCFAEVEFESVEESNIFKKPDWFGEDVSGDRRYRNGFLSEQTGLECFENENLCEE